MTAVPRSWSSAPGRGRDPALLLEEQLDEIRGAAAKISRRSGLSHDEAAEYVAWAIARLVWDDYAVLRKFEGRSSLKTFITRVLARLLADYRNAAWGRWRPSREALRLGEAAVRLERMVYRDRIPVREAIARIQSEERLTGSEIAALLARLPRRWRVEEVGFGQLKDEAGLSLSTSRLEDEEERQAFASSLLDALAELDAEERVVLHGCYWQGRSVAELANHLGLDAKRLYRRLDRIRAKLRAALEARGLDRVRFRETYGGESEG